MGRRLPGKSFSSKGPQDQVECKFAKMRITDNASESDANSGRISPQPQPQDQDLHKNTGHSDSRRLTRGSPPAIPLVVYRNVQKAVAIMKRPKGPNQAQDLVDLQAAEYGIRVACNFYKSVLPPGWKYTRETASTLIAGYDKTYREGGHTFIHCRRLLGKSFRCSSKGTQDQLHKTGGSVSRRLTRGYPPAIPLSVYDEVKIAVDIMARPKGPNQAQDLVDLREAEHGIRVVCNNYQSLLPPGWKYDRETASALIAGYDKTYRQDGHTFIT